MGGQELAEYLHEDGYIRLLQCFLNPALMVEHKEAPNALTDQQVLQLGSDGRAKVLHREGQQVDPIYQFFRPGQEEKLGKAARAGLELGWHGLGWAGTGWAGLGWAGLGWHGSQWVLRCCSFALCW